MFLEEIMFGRPTMQPESSKITLPEAPQWLVEILTRKTANTDGGPQDFMSPGSRNSNLTSLAGHYRRKGLCAEAIFEQLMASNSTATEPLDEQEVRNIANSVSRYSPELKGEMHDVPMSRIIARMISDACRFVPETGWLVYDGRSWVQDLAGVLAREQIKLKLEIFVEAVKSRYDADTAREAKKYLANTKVNAMQSLVQADPNVFAKMDCFDRDPSLLNVRNGTLDLSVGKLRPHAAEDMLTKVANVDFAPDADCPTFKKVLSRSLPDPHAAFLLRYLGYALLGDPTEQVLAILYGAGANGKSTLINGVSYLLGDYAANIEPSTLIKQKSERIRTDIARLHGVHLALTSELGIGEILDAALVKRLTGGDMITARALYTAEFEFKPKFSLVMTTNALPVIDGSDAALARRLILLPFNNVIPEAERESRLNRKLEAEASGILNLLMIGLSQYREIGLAIPEDIKEEARKFAESSDMLASFISDTVDWADDGNVPAQFLYSQYQLWCSRRGIRSLSAPQFKQEMAKKGHKSKRINSGNVWVGVRMRFSQI